MRMDTGREAFNTQIASNTVALVDRRVWNDARAFGGAPVARRQYLVEISAAPHALRLLIYSFLSRPKFGAAVSCPAATIALRSERPRVKALASASPSPQRIAR